MSLVAPGNLFDGPPPGYCKCGRRAAVGTGGWCSFCVKGPDAPPLRAPAAPHFDGATYEPAKDHARLSTQLRAVKAILDDGEWHRLSEILERLGGEGTEQGVSARVRDLRKRKFGGHRVERRRVGGKGGLFEYRLPQHQTYEQTGSV